ncbi:MAG: glycoside hydrolase family 3 C-terminal domain-containing protein, partial [Planctomycetota bacterium]
QTADPSAPDALLACAKHYVAYGAAEGGRDYDATEISEFTLHNVYLRPFQAAVQEAGVASVMCGFHTIGGEAVSGSRRLLTDILKHEWDWDGFVVSDWGSVEQLRGHGVAADLRAAAAIGFNAGVDMEMTALSYPEHLEELIEAGMVAESRLDDAVRRILTAKFKAGLFERPYVDEQRWNQVKRCPEHVSMAVELACRSMVLLRNDGILPLSVHSDAQSGKPHIVVGGPFAHERRAHLGSWCLRWDHDEITSIADGLRAAMDGDAWIDIEESPFVDRLLVKAVSGACGQQAVRLTAVVLCVGESEANNGEASSTASLQLPADQEALIEQVGSRALPLVVVNCSGRPLVSPAAERYANAILQAWNLGTEAGTAIARVLFGQAEPGGRLPITIPANSAQVPCYYNRKPVGKIHEWPHYQAYRDEAFQPLYRFGYGLGYTTWAYEDLRLSTPRISAGESIAATVTVRNTGQRAGSTVVQCYLRDPVASIARPVRELVGFQRIQLDPGEQQEVVFDLGPEQLAYYGASHRWGVDPGTFQVFVGGDSSATLQEDFVVV